jgi:hypothetical protein
LRNSAGKACLFGAGDSLYIFNFVPRIGGEKKKAIDLSVKQCFQKVKELWMNLLHSFFQPLKTNNASYLEESFDWKK